MRSIRRDFKTASERAPPPSQGCGRSRGARTMSGPNLRRADRAMTSEAALAALERGFAGRLATVGEDGYPYCVPMLNVWADNQVLLHGTSALGHLQTNVRREPRVCFELDEPDQVFDYGRFECDRSEEHTSELQSQFHLVCRL